MSKSRLCFSQGRIREMYVGPAQASEHHQQRRNKVICMRYANDFNCGAHNEQRGSADCDMHTCTRYATIVLMVLHAA
jgi:hypothetical protein